MSTSIIEVSKEDLPFTLKKTGIVIIDVREPEEFIDFNIGGKNIPSHLLNEHADYLKNLQNILVVCSNGLRSSILARVINKKHPHLRVFHLSEGIL
ncbi:MAG: rhodanese-like domain-containing protein [Leadbetterella sp.]